MLDGKWTDWMDSSLGRGAGSDSGLRAVSGDMDKAQLVAEYIYSQYLQGRRGTACHKETAAIRHEYTCNVWSTSFLGSEVEPYPLIKKASRACTLNPEELRKKVSSWRLQSEITRRK